MLWSGVRQSVMFPCLRVDSRRHDTHRLSSDITAQHAASPHRLPPIPGQRCHRYCV